MSKSEQKRICIQSQCAVRDELRSQLDNLQEQLEQKDKEIRHHVDRLKYFIVRNEKLERVVEAAKKAMNLCVPEASTEDEFYEALNQLNEVDDE